LEPLAGWRALRGSWDEARYPTIGIRQARSVLTANPALVGQLAAIDVGGYLSVINPRDDLPPDRIEVLPQYYEETLANFERDITFDCVPAGPYLVGVYDDPLTARYDSAATTTDEALTTTETGVNIAIGAGEPGWVTTASNPGEFPFDINIGGERMTCTANTSTGAGTYTMTVIRSANGVIKSHLTNAPVHLWRPGRYAY